MIDRMKNVLSKKHRGSAQYLKLSTIIIAFLSFTMYSACGGESSGDSADSKKILPLNAIAVNSPTPYTVTTDPNLDYSRFTHSNESHARLPCLLCHQTDQSPTKLKFPGKNGHLPCAGCHVEQFKATEGPMCSICHTDSVSGEMKPFPALASFKAKFDHSRHVSQASCSTCHAPTQRGAGFSVPTRSNAHSTCFQCHGTETRVAKAMAEKGTVIDSCNTCHTQGNPGPAHSFVKYEGSFSHARHVNVKGLSCNSCHTIRAGSGEMQVSAPLMAMHKAIGKSLSCATCHNGKRAFGAEDFTNCKRCHQGNSFSF